MDQDMFSKVTGVIAGLTVLMPATKKLILTVLVTNHAIISYPKMC